MIINIFEPNKNEINKFVKIIQNNNSLLYKKIYNTYPYNVLDFLIYYNKEKLLHEIIMNDNIKINKKYFKQSLIESKNLLLESAKFLFNNQPDIINRLILKHKIFISNIILTTYPSWNLNDLLDLGFFN